MIGAVRQWLRQRAVDRIQVSDNAWATAEAGLPFLAHLSAEERAQLRQRAREFLAEKEWSTAQGLVLTPAIQLSITLQACLPILHLGLDHYRGWVGIVVYPGDFVIRRNVMDENGVVHVYDDPVLGEAWEDGPVVVSWFDRPEEADGVNVVLHEFAHKLDMENGITDGLPRLPASMSRQAWIDAFAPAYADFCRRIDAGEHTTIDPYAAEHPAEFFAVVSEVFFETPDVLSNEYPAVYEQLRRFYRQDPLHRPS